MSDKIMSRFNVNMEKELLDRFKKVAKANDTDASKLFRIWVKEYLKKNAQTTMN